MSEFMEPGVRVLPAIPLRGVTVLPDMVRHFDVSREKSMRAVEDAMLHDEIVFLVTQRSIKTAEPTLDDLYEIGTIARIKQVVRLRQGRIRVLAEGIERAELLDFDNTGDFIRAEVACFERPENLPDEMHTEAMRRELKELFSAYAVNGTNFSNELVVQILEIEDLEKLVDQICINLPLDYTRQQRLLNAAELADRYDVLCGMLANEAEIQKIRAELQAKVKERIDKNQKEYILRAQLKEIR
jgi:ATP-dependent Lon protease